MRRNDLKSGSLGKTGRFPTPLTTATKAPAIKSSWRKATATKTKSTSSPPASLIPVLESQADHGLQAKQLPAYTAYVSDQNMEDCREGVIHLISPVAAEAPASPASEAGDPDQKPASAQAAASVHPDQKETISGTSENPARKAGLQARREEEKTETWKKEYAKRSGQEGVNGALDRVTASKRLVVRGKRSVSMALYLKTVGWNITKAGWVYAQRGIAARKKTLQAA